MKEQKRMTDILFLQNNIQHTRKMYFDICEINVYTNAPYSVHYKKIWKFIICIIELNIHEWSISSMYFQYIMILIGLDRTIFYEDLRFSVRGMYLFKPACLLLRKSVISNPAHQYEIRNAVECTH